MTDKFAPAIRVPDAEQGIQYCHDRFFWATLHLRFFGAYER